ncbi:MAG: amidohydrolase family protein [Rhodospirillales bacterium]|nr:amidohydrolase family protein [Rhodospirillales bacterium]
MKIDIYTHIFPEKFFEKWMEAAPGLADIGKRMKSVRAVSDLDFRFKKMDEVEDYAQIISLPNPPLEAITTPEIGTELAHIANETMAELVDKYPDRFPGFVAALAMHNFDGAMKEMRHAIADLGAKGAQTFTQVKGRPLDDPHFDPFFKAMHGYDLPIWLHPARPAEVKDFGQEEKSRYEMWWALGWPYDTSVTMTRLAITGLYDRYPGLKIITHHCGGMIPFFEGRLDVGMESLGQRTSDEDYSEVLSSLKRPHGEYYKMFYADTAMFGATIGTKCGIEYFGADNVVFASDCPFASIPEAVGMMDHLGLNDVDKEKIFKGNAERLMNTSFG